MSSVHAIAATIILALIAAVGLEVAWPVNDIFGVIGVAAAIWVIAALPTALFGLIKGLQRFRFSIISWVIIAIIVVYSNAVTRSYEWCLDKLPNGADQAECL